jgi:hypothetical protein
VKSVAAVVAFMAAFLPRSPAAPATVALKSDPVNVQLSGSQAAAWSKAALAALKAPATSANVKTMEDWFLNEGTPHDNNNPLNLQTPYGGSKTSTANRDPASDHIQAYPTPGDFVHAFALEMEKGSYGAIVDALRAGRGLEKPDAATKHELKLYSGGGYSTIPAGYCPCS